MFQVSCSLNFLKEFCIEIEIVQLFTRFRKMRNSFRRHDYSRLHWKMCGVISEGTRCPEQAGRLSFHRFLTFSVFLYLSLECLLQGNLSLLVVHASFIWEYIRSSRPHGTDRY